MLEKQNQVGSNNVVVDSDGKRRRGLLDVLENRIPDNLMRDRASIYAQGGLWYDALADLSTAQTLNPKEQSLKEDFLSLLDQVGLTEVAMQERQRLAKN